MKRVYKYLRIAFGIISRMLIIVVCFCFGWFWRDVTAKRDASNFRLHIRVCLEAFSDTIMSEFENHFDKDVFERSFRELIIELNKRRN